MGIILLPFLIGAIIIIVICVRNFILLFNSEIIGVNEIGFGFLLSLLLFVIITISYIVKGKIWNLSPFFRIPLVTIFIPFLIHFVIKMINIPSLNYLSNLLIVSISINGILGIAFNYILFDLLAYFNVKKHY
ncbi:hypothetical protein [Tenacibaculum sp. M341]|uniref:hypothetical protein n=1 Tax=Tenacibaculum sp. M341 TaxID=2530339 RepID=UPI00104629AC|nr:hypothetical protein [Tenacibaculum sp. M341]TCI84532.1 hypothetical protein EYW44_21040 [Tenacibaculum sp. M341]